ncbi:MAG: DNA-binding GntR family transcriptional regulator [Desulforhopalus sp.]|jgi:DNA-binding GntR family transcriptional regulator
MGQSKKQNSENSVYQKLKIAIRKRYIKQGSQLVEVTLAQKLGVSRTPVRSAIKKLEAEGLVNSIPNRGAFVITPTRREIEETFLVRAELECMAVGLATLHSTDAKIDELKQFIEFETTVFDKSNLDNYYAANDSFHLRIAEMSGNNVLCTYIQKLLDRTRIYLILYDPFFKIEYSPTTEHLDIIKGIASGDQQKACAAVRAHINSSINGLEAVGELPEDYISL